MDTESDPYKPTSTEMVTKYFGVIMVLGYIAIGVTMVLPSSRVFNLPRMYAVPLGILMIAYGIFRGYKLYQRHFTKIQK